MSLEVFGDEGDVPSHWDETAMRQEFDAIKFRWSEWQRTHRAEWPNDEFAKLMEVVDEALDEIGFQMEGLL